jgi:hypothetical protein
VSSWRHVDTTTGINLFLHSHLGFREVASIKTPRATTKAICDSGKASHDEVGVIRGGGEASDTEQI